MPSTTPRPLDAQAKAYLDLLRHVLTDFQRIGPDDGTRFPDDRTDRMVEERKAARRDGSDWPQHAETMIGLLRLEQFQRAIETVVADGVPGDIVETGTWRGGGCILARAVLRMLDVSDRRGGVADSFQGSPPPDPARYPADAGDCHHTVDFLRVDLESVRAAFQRYGQLDDQVRFLPGWFHDTLPKAPIDTIS